MFHIIVTIKHLSFVFSTFNTKKSYGPGGKPSMLSKFLLLFLSEHRTGNKIVIALREEKCSRFDCSG